MRIIAGKFKGRKIPFNNKKFDNADITTEKVKEAIFSIIGENILDSNFLDLFSCSGQIGLEALSRGAKQVIFNEINKKRYNFIQTIINDFNITGNYTIYNLPAEKCLKMVNRNEYLFDIIFIDPPYIKNTNQVNIYMDLVSKIGELNLLKKNGLLIIQHYSKNSLAEKIKKYLKIKTKIYGNNTLSIYFNKE